MVCPRCECHTTAAQEKKTDHKENYGKGYSESEISML